MYDFDHILLALDFTELDNYLLKYTFEFARLASSDKIVLMHVVNRAVKLDEDVPDPEKQGATVTQREIILRKMQQLVAQNTGEGQQAEVVMRVKNGDPLTDILNVARKQDADVVVVGRKTVAEGSGELARKLVRRAICSVLIVPVQAIPKFGKALVPVDFSDYSQMGLSTAAGLARKMDWQMHIQCLNVYSLPNGYLASGKSKDEFAEIMAENARRRFNYFVKTVKAPEAKISCKYQLDTRNQAAKLIFNIGLVERVDLIIMGSRGRTNFAAAFLGSTTEKMLQHNISIPTLVIKKKEQNFGFFDALLNI